MNARALLLPALTGLVVVSGCGGSDSGSGSSSSSAPAPSGPVTVDMKNIQFAPKSQSVKAGQKVTWVNQDSVDHDVKADSGADFHSDQFGKGGKFAFTPQKAGEIKYECTLHPGMTGTLKVV
jgi:plastocyanin